jgi:hypothetical protein
MPRNAGDHPSTASLFTPRTSAQSPFPPPFIQRSKHYNKRPTNMTFPQILNSTKSYPLEPSHPSQLLFRLGAPKDSANNPHPAHLNSRGPNGTPLANGEYRQVFKDMVMQAQANRHSFAFHQKIEKLDREPRAPATHMADPNSSEFFNKLHMILAETRIATSAQALAAQAWQSRKNMAMQETLRKSGELPKQQESEKNVFAMQNLDNMLSQINANQSTNRKSSPIAAFASSGAEHVLSSSSATQNGMFRSGSVYSNAKMENPTEVVEDILIPKRLTVSKFASKINVRATEVLRCLATITKRTYKTSDLIDFEICEIVALEFGKTLKLEEAIIPARAPVVSVMGEDHIAIHF